MDQYRPTEGRMDRTYGEGATHGQDLGVRFSVDDVLEERVVAASEDDGHVVVAVVTVITSASPFSARVAAQDNSQADATMNP